MRTQALATMVALLALTGCGGGGGGGGGEDAAPSAADGAAAAPSGAAADGAAAGMPGPAATPPVAGPVQDPSWPGARPAAGPAATGLPTLSGAPPTRVPVGTEYRFEPQASDPDGDPLEFRAVQLPAWATLDPGTGRITGSPRPGDQGRYGPITLSVSDGTNRVALPPFTIEVLPPGTAIVKRSVTLNWIVPDSATDGSPLDEPLKFRIHGGRASRAYDEVVGVTEPGVNRYTVKDLDPGIWYLAITSVSHDGVESDYSDETVARLN